MSIDVRLQKALSAPAGRHMHVLMSLLTELVSFFCRSYIHSAPLALARCLTHKIRCGQQISNFVLDHLLHSCGEDVDLARRRIDIGCDAQSLELFVFDCGRDDAVMIEKVGR
jgi:hypothetical protein